MTVMAESNTATAVLAGERGPNASQKSVPSRLMTGRLHEWRKVYDRCMARTRTNIEIEDRYIEAIKARYGVHTKTEAVEIALRHLVGQPMTREEALAMRGAHAMDEVPDTGPA